MNIIPKIEIDGNEIERVKDFNFLGLVLNENLSWKPHVNGVCNKLAKYIGIMCRLKRFLPLNILRTLYCSMVQSNMNYSLLVWGFNCGRLKKMQKKFLRIITCSSYNAHTEPLFKCLKLLKLEDLFVLNVLKFYYKYEHGKLPFYFGTYSLIRQEDIHNYPTRNRFVIPRNVTRTHAAQKCLRHHIPVVLNAVSNNIIEKVNTHSYQGFSNYVKNNFIEKYSLVCLIEDCYVCSR